MGELIQIRALLLALLLAAAIAVTIIGTSSSSSSFQNQNRPSKERRQAPDLERWPLTDYEAALPPDPANRVKRQVKNKRYDKSDWPIAPNDVADNTVRLHQLKPDLAAFPVQESTVILIGRVADAAAYLSNDKTGIYSEFTVVIEEVLRNNLADQPMPGSSIALTREGGRVHFPSGRIHWYGIAGQRMPQLGGRYVFFLTGQSVEALTILTGYELSAGKVSPLDDLTNAQKYLNADEGPFLDSLKRVISSP